MVRSPCLAKGESWLLRASRAHGGKEFALLVSPDGQRAASCPTKGVDLANAQALNLSHALTPLLDLLWGELGHAGSVAQCAHQKPPVVVAATNPP